MLLAPPGPGNSPRPTSSLVVFLEGPRLRHLAAAQIQRRRTGLFDGSWWGSAEIARFLLLGSATRRMLFAAGLSSSNSSSDNSNGEDVGTSPVPFWRALRRSGVASEDSSRRSGLGIQIDFLGDREGPDSPVSLRVGGAHLAPGECRCPTAILAAGRRRLFERRCAVPESGSDLHVAVAALVEAHANAAVSRVGRFAEFRRPIRARGPDLLEAHCRLEDFGVSGTTWKSRPLP